MGITLRCWLFDSRMLAQGTLHRHHSVFCFLSASSKSQTLRWVNSLLVRILSQISKAKSLSSPVSLHNPWQMAWRILIISGGATGIGAATVKILAKHGAQVLIGDINTSAAEELARQTTGVTTARCDVTNYDDIYQLFRLAHEQYGVVHHAISSAGILEQGNWFDPALTIETIKNPGNTKVIDINLMGSLNFARIAAVFLRDGLQKGENRSLTLLSSVNAFRDSPGLYLYQVRRRSVRRVFVYAFVDFKARYPRASAINSDDTL